MAVTIAFVAVNAEAVNLFTTKLPYCDIFSGSAVMCFLIYCELVYKLYYAGHLQNIWEKKLFHLYWYNFKMPHGGNETLKNMC